MDLLELVKKVNEMDVKNKEQIEEIVEKIDVTPENLDNWIKDIFSEKVDEFDMNKLPYLIDELYQTDTKLKFMICCMLLEATCDKLKLAPSLEKYDIFKAKFELFIDTLITVYDKVNNSIANTMSLIILDKDPDYEYFNDEQKNRIIEITKRKLSNLLKYLKDNKEDYEAYNDLEIIVDMACYLKDEGINELVNEIDKLEDNKHADIFIMKYKVINDMELNQDKINRIINEEGDIDTLYRIMENLNVNKKYLGDVTQEMIAKSAMIRWLIYPTELGDIPDTIELLGEFEFEDQICYAYKFSKKDFKIEGELLGIVGGYEKDTISARSSGYTFSKFEPVAEDWETQGKALAQEIYDHWKEVLEEKNKK